MSVFMIECIACTHACRWTRLQCNWNFSRLSGSVVLYKRTLECHSTNNKISSAFWICFLL